jgi:hypothetical protein
MKHLKYLAFTAVALALVTSVVTANAATGKPPAQGTPPAGQQGQPPDGKGGPGGGGPGGRGGVEGTVTAISGSSYTIQDTRAQTTTETTVTLTDTVKVRYLITDTAASLSDIVVGSKVQVRGRPGDNNTTSVEEVIIEPAGTKVNGHVSAVSGDTITVKARGDETYSIVTSSSTQFLKGTTSISLSDVTTETQVTAYGSLSDSTLTATVVIVDGGRGGGSGGQQGNPPQDGSGQPAPQGTPPGN